MRYLFVLIFLCISVLSSAQAIKVRFNVTPSEGAELFLDGENKGKADNQKLLLGFNERKGILSYDVEIKCSGYESQQYTFDKDSPKSQTIDCNLERKFNKFDNPPALIFDVEKVVSGIEYATDVGANTRWKYRYDEEINLSTKMPKMLKALSQMGLGTMQNSSDDLFDVGKKKPTTPDFIIAGRVETFSLARTSGSYNSNISINWQVFDRHQKEIVLKVTNTTEYKFENNLISEQFYESVLNNFYNLVTEVDGFRVMVEGIDESETVYATDSSGNSEIEVNGEDVEQVLIQPVRLEAMEDFSDLVELAMNSSVTVIIDQDKGHGSGVVVSSNGYVVTNHHVTDGAKIIDVQFSNGIMLPADLITSSEKHDLSLIKVRASGLTALPILEDPNDVREGDEVFVIGAPGDIELGQSVSKGIISAKRNIDGVRVIQTDTKISPGSSGSPLINREGEIIGIINMKMVGDGVEGLSFAIDGRYLKSVLGLEYE
jgi:hypothetical protein